MSDVAKLVELDAVQTVKEVEAWTLLSVVEIVIIDPARILKPS